MPPHVCLNLMSEHFTSAKPAPRPVSWFSPTSIVACRRQALAARALGAGEKAQARAAIERCVVLATALGVAMAFAVGTFRWVVPGLCVLTKCFPGGSAACIVFGLGYPWELSTGGSGDLQAKRTQLSGGSDTRGLRLRQCADVLFWTRNVYCCRTHALQLHAQSLERGLHQIPFCPLLHHAGMPWRACSARTPRSLHSLQVGG